jgi:hypothetical protein
VVSFNIVNRDEEVLLGLSPAIRRRNQSVCHDLY